MNVDVYDSYAKDKNGQLIHFDVLVEAGAPAETAFKYGQLWLESVGYSASDLDQNRCNFCHSELAKSEVKEEIQKNKFYILKMEGCPR